MRVVIIGRDGPDAPSKRVLHRARHLERLRPLDAEGRVILAGPFADRTGSLIILEVESVAAARAFIEQDPYVTEGVFESVEIHPFTTVLPSP
jgi:uncharacterized protein YciI